MTRYLPILGNSSTPLWEKTARHLTGTIPDMGNNLRALRESRGWTQDQAADAFGLSKSGYLKLERGERQLALPRIEQAAQVYGVEPSEVFSEEANLKHGVPVMGFIGAGAEILPEFEQVPPDGLETIDLPFNIPEDIIAFRVRGHSMLPVYKDGDAILVHREQRLATDAYVGEDVACRTKDGRRFLKEIQYGKRRGIFNLYSHNAPLIEDVAIEWIGEIYLIVKAQQIRRVETANRAKQAAFARKTAGMGRLL